MTRNAQGHGAAPSTAPDSAPTALEVITWPVHTERLLLRAATSAAELGWVLHPDYAGHGYATEAVRELLRLCFDELGLRRVTAGCFAANTASWRLMERGWDAA